MTLRGKTRSWWRFIRFALFTFTIVMRIVILKRVVGEKSYPRRLEIRRQWAHHTMFNIYKFRVEITGELPPQNEHHLFISNHRASIDPIIHMAYCKANPVSKAAVEHYPLVGYGAKASGIIYVDKENRKSRAATKVAIAAALTNKKSVLLFPEGRTHGEESLLKFHIGSFRVASETNTPIFPMAIDYKNPKDYWTHEEPFLVHFQKQFGVRKETFVKVRLGNTIPPAEPQVMLDVARTWMVEQVDQMKKEW